MKRALLLLLFVFAFACGGASSNVAEPGPFDPSGLKLVIGVERTKTFEVKPGGSVESSETGNAVMTFVGQELRLVDGSKTLLVLDGDTLRGPNAKPVGTFEGDALSMGAMRIAVKDDGVVKLAHDGKEGSMRMHFVGTVAGHKRAAIMLVVVVFSLYVVTHPNATLDAFLD